MKGNRVRWFPGDRLPMQSVESRRAAGGAFALMGLAMLAFLVYAIRALISQGDAGGVVFLSGLALLSTLGTLWGVHLLWYRKTIVIDHDSVRVEIRTLRGTTSRSTPLVDYEAIVQMDSEARWSKYSLLLLPDPDPRFSVCLAATPRGSSALPVLHDHFSKLLRLRKETSVWSLP